MGKYPRVRVIKYRNKGCEKSAPRGSPPAALRKQSAPWRARSPWGLRGGRRGREGFSRPGSRTRPPEPLPVPLQHRSPWPLLQLQPQALISPRPTPSRPVNLAIGACVAGACHCWVWPVTLRAEATAPSLSLSRGLRLCPPGRPPQPLPGLRPGLRKRQESTESSGGSPEPLAGGSAPPQGAGHGNNAAPAAGFPRGQSPHPPSRIWAPTQPGAPELLGSSPCPDTQQLCGLRQAAHPL